MTNTCSVSTPRAYIVTHEYIPADGSALLLGDRVSIFIYNYITFISPCFHSVVVLKLQQYSAEY